jgi:hypothetical protein
LTGMHSGTNDLTDNPERTDGSQLARREQI